MIEVKDIIILQFLDQYIPTASATLGEWYLGQLNAGLDHSKIEEYILKQWLPTLGYAAEQVTQFEDAYLKYESDYAQSLLDKETTMDQEVGEVPLVQEEIKEEVIEQVTEKLIDNTVKFNMKGFLYLNLSAEYHPYIDQVIKWYNQVDNVTGDNYIFGQWLPSFLPQEQIQIILTAYSQENTKSNKVESIDDMVMVAQVEEELSKPIETIEYSKETFDMVEKNALPEITKFDGVTGTVHEANQQEIPTEYQVSDVTNVSSNLATMREIEKEVEERLFKLSLLKEPYFVNGNYVNDSYKICPSFKNLIAPIQNAIIVKREQKANEKWFEKYRPELVEEILFPNQTIKETITEYVSKGRIAGNCLFYGTGGVGKTTTNIVLMNAVLKNNADRFFLDRKVESVDALKGWLNKKPIGDQKIVIAEEFDRLSDAAMTELKNGLMEKYEYVVFLASTNKIHKIDEALLTRFTLISKFETAQVSDITNKCKYILTNERIQFTEEDLDYFVEQNKLRGIRTILNNLQLSCYMGVFEPKRTAFFIGDSGTEYDMVAWIKWYINYLIQLPKQSLWYLSYDINQDQNVAQARGKMLETLLANYSLNYDYIFMELLKDNIFLPIKNCINMYYQDIETKRVKPMHFEAMLNDFINILFTTKDVYANN